MPWNSYPAIAATLISISCLSYLAYRKYTGNNPRPLSELALDSGRALLFFRLVLWLCGSLFAISMYSYVIPNLRFSTLQTVSWSLTYIPELLLAAIPARGKTLKIHAVLAGLMAVGMFGSACIFLFGVTGTSKLLEGLLVTAMSLCVIATISDKRHYLIYELLFIFSAHISILVAILFI